MNSVESTPAVSSDAASTKLDGDDGGDNPRKKAETETATAPTTITAPEKKQEEGEAELAGKTVTAPKEDGLKKTTITAPERKQEEEGTTESPPGEEKNKLSDDVTAKDGEAPASEEKEESKEEGQQQEDADSSVRRELKKKKKKPPTLMSPPVTTRDGANTRARRKAVEAATANHEDKSSKKRSSSSSSPKKKKAPPPRKGKASFTGAPTTKRKRGPKDNQSKDNNSSSNKKPKTTTTKLDNDDDVGGPKVDGRSKNKGAAKRESYSVTFKAKMVKDFDAWEAEQIELGNKSPSVREFVLTKQLPHKYENFLSKSNGWRSPKNRARILQDSTVSDYQHMARMPDRSKNKSYYADMEEALLKRLEEARAKNLTVTTKTIRLMAREELRRLTNNDEEKVNAFKASNGWVYNFLKRQERKAKDEAMKQKREKANLKKQQKSQKEQEQEEEAPVPNNNGKQEGGRAGEEGEGAGSSSKELEEKIARGKEKSVAEGERPAMTDAEPTTATAPEVAAAEGNTQQAHAEEGSDQNAATTQNNSDVDTIEI